MLIQCRQEEKGNRDRQLHDWRALTTTLVSDLDGVSNKGKLASLAINAYLQLSEARSALTNYITIMLRDTSMNTSINNTFVYQPRNQGPRRTKEEILCLLLQAVFLAYYQYAIPPPGNQELPTRICPGIQRFEDAQTVEHY